MQQEKKTSRQNLFKPVHALVALAITLAPTLIYSQTQSGTLDASFGTGGTVTTDFAGSGDGAAAIAVQPDGKLVAAGGATINGQIDFALARYNSNGTLDTSFGTGGRVTTDFGGRYERATSVAVQWDGKIVVAGGAVINVYNDFALARYHSDGTLDTNFGTGGKVITNFGEVSAQAYSVAVLPDGKIVVAGEANIDGGDDFALVRYTSNGTLDDNFGTGGKVTTDFGLRDQGFSYANAYSVAVQPADRIVVAGEAFIGSGYDLRSRATTATARWTPASAQPAR
jgi:uncharacterized delta-60 repeat protein